MRKTREVVSTSGKLTLAPILKIEASIGAVRLGLLVEGDHLILVTGVEALGHHAPARRLDLGLQRFELLGPCRRPMNTV